MVDSGCKVLNGFPQLPVLLEEQLKDLADRKRRPFPVVHADLEVFWTIIHGAVPENSVIDEECLGLSVIGVAAPPLGRALGLAQVLPVGRSVPGPGKPQPVHEGLQQLYRGVAEGRPVPLKGPDIGGEDLGGQVLHPDPRQDQKPHVVDHLMEVALLKVLK